MSLERGAQRKDVPRARLGWRVRELRREHTFFWFYSGSDDRVRKENRAFALQLSQLRIPHHYFEAFGGHNWGLWRRNALAAYLAAIARVSHA